MAIQTYSIDEEIAQKFKNQTPERKTSARLEELMADYIQEDSQKLREDVKLLDRDKVTPKRRQLFKKILEKDLDNLPDSKIRKALHKHSLYTGDSGKHHYREAVKFMIREDDVPLTKDYGGNLVFESKECMDEDCDSEFSVKVLKKNDMECPACGRGYVI